MTLEAWDPDANVTYDQAMWAEPTSLRFLEDAHNALILGPSAGWVLVQAAAWGRGQRS